MKIFEIIWRIFAILVSVAVLVLAIVLGMQDPLNTTLLIALYAVAYLFSLSTAIRWARRACENASGLGKFFTYLAFIILNVALTPITLVVSIFGRTKRIHNLNNYVPNPYDFEGEAQKATKKAKKADRKREVKASRAEKNTERERQLLEREKIKLERMKLENEALRIKSEKARMKSERKSAKRGGKRHAAYDGIHADISSSVWRASSRQAIAKILDDSYKGDIKLDDGIESKTYKQVALIKLTGRQYALLSPKNTQDELYGSAVAFAIAPDARTGERTLQAVEDEGLYKKIFSVYETLLAESNFG